METKLIFRLYVILAFLLCAHNEAFAQWREPRLTHLGPEEGISSWTFDITQDSTGYMYFGTDQGLVRYDGNSFELFAHIPDDSTSIGPGDVWCLYTGADDEIWIGTRMSGLNVFYPKTRKFKRFDTPNKKRSDYDAVFSIYEDEKKQVWVGGQNYMLHLFDKYTETFQTYRPDWVLTDFRGISGNISQILPDRNHPHILWLSIINHHPDLKNEMIAGLVSFDTKTKSFVAYPCWGQPKYQDQEENLWLASKGINTFNTKNNSCDHIPVYNDAAHQKDEIKIRDISPYKNELIISSVYTIQSLLANGNIKHIVNDKDIGIVEDIFIDAQQNLWFGRNNGITILNAQEELIKFYSLENHGVSKRIYPSRIAYDHTSNSILVIDNAPHSSHDQIISIPIDTGNSKILLKSPDFVSGIAADPSGTLWINSGNQIKTFNPHHPERKEKPIKFRNSARIPDLWNLSICNDVWIGGVSSNEFIWFSSKQNVIHSIGKKDLPQADGQNYSTNLQGVTFTKKNKALLFSNEVFEIDLTTKEITKLQIEAGVNLYPKAEINSVIQDTRGHIWIATLAMTAEFNQVGDSLLLIKKYTTKDGMGSAWVHELYPDQSGRVWAFAQNGLNAIDPVEQEVRQFGVKEGLADPYIDPRQVVSLSDGSMATTNGNGVIVFHPDSLWNGYTPLNIPIVLKEIRTNGKSINFEGDVNNIPGITLKPNQDNIDIQFQGLAYPTDYNLTYSYKVEGLNNSWISIGENKIVTLSSLSPGTYRLKIKAGAASSPAPVKTLEIYLATPILQKPWFAGLLAFLVAASLYLIYKWRIRNIRHQEEAKLQVTKKMAELELKALRSQMNPHFMFNSLNSIKNYILQAKPKLAAEYLSNFSHLIRMILQNSGEKEISLQEELETLILYIELEQIRFERKFEFNCLIEDGIRMDSIRIPPMILQPYVENAIWHGLMHKSEPGHLLLRFSKKGGMILCEIDDDGIGRQKSGDLKSQNSAKYKSMGMGITRDRIDILNKMNSLGISAEVIDKFDTKGHASGTCVIVSIPDTDREDF